MTVHYKNRHCPLIDKNCIGEFCIRSNKWATKKFFYSKTLTKIPEKRVGFFNRRVMYANRLYWKTTFFCTEEKEYEYLNCSEYTINLFFKEIKSEPINKWLGFGDIPIPDCEYKIEYIDGSDLPSRVFSIKEVKKIRAVMPHKYSDQTGKKWHSTDYLYEAIE